MILRFSHELKKEYASRMRKRYPMYDKLGATDNHIVRILKNAVVLLVRALLRGYIVKTKNFYLFMATSPKDYTIISKAVRKIDVPNGSDFENGFMRPFKKTEKHHPDALIESETPMV